MLNTWGFLLYTSALLKLNGYARATICFLYVTTLLSSTLRFTYYTKNKYIFKPSPVSIHSIFYKQTYVVSDVGNKGYTYTQLLAALAEDSLSRVIG